MSETLINIGKSSILVGLLKNLIIALDPLAIHDTGLKRLSRSFYFYLQELDQVPAETLLAELNQIATIIKSYDIKVQEGSVTSSIQAIPHLLYDAIQEVDHLLTLKRIERNDIRLDTTAKLLNQIDQFVKAAQE